MGVMPFPGSEEFTRKAKDPNSMESKILRAAHEDAAKQFQDQVRAQLDLMIELVPGQLFRDIAKFHEKFGVEPTKDPGHRLPDDVLMFRAKFLLEELREYLNACGLDISWNTGEGIHIKKVSDEFDAEQAFDGLIDLVVVALGTSHSHQFPFNAGWDRVNSANMAKVKSTGDGDGRSRRGSKFDIVKPEGWKPPVLRDLLHEACSYCRGDGTVSVSVGVESRERLNCTECGGTGRVRRKP